MNDCNRCGGTGWRRFTVDEIKALSTDVERRWAINGNLEKRCECGAEDIDEDSGPRWGEMRVMVLSRDGRVKYPVDRTQTETPGLAVTKIDDFYSVTHIGSGKRVSNMLDMATDAFCLAADLGALGIDWTIADGDQLKHDIIGRGLKRTVDEIVSRYQLNDDEEEG